MQTVHELTPEQMAATARKGPPPPYVDPGPITAESLRQAPQGSPANDRLLRPNIFIAGPSGSGKSTALRNLDPATTIILSTEQRPLPFPGSSRFKLYMRVANLAQFQRVFAKALSSAVADVVVVDSFTSLAEYAYTAFVKNAERAGDGSFDAWKFYKDCLHDILIQAKTSNKQVIFLGIDAPMQDDQNRVTTGIDVQGSLRGKVEKEFDVVFWTKVFDIDITNPKKERYLLCTNSDGHNKAKSPMEMFDELYIPNDLAAVLPKMTAYFNENYL